MRWRGFQPWEVWRCTPYYQRGANDFGAFLMLKIGQKVTFEEIIETLATYWRIVLNGTSPRLRRSASCAPARGSPDWPSGEAADLNQKIRVNPSHIRGRGGKGLMQVASLRNQTRASPSTQGLTQQPVWPVKGALPLRYMGQAPYPNSHRQTLS